jgi:hypothetical protein
VADVELVKILLEQRERYSTERKLDLNGKRG